MALEPRHFGVVRVADRAAEPDVELVAVEDHLSRVHRLDRTRRNAEVPRVPDEDHNPIRKHSPNPTELLAAAEEKCWEPDFNRLRLDSTRLGGRLHPS